MAHFDTTTCITALLGGGGLVKFLEAGGRAWDRARKRPLDVRAQDAKEEADLRDDQSEIIRSLKIGATDWQTLVTSLVQSAQTNATLTGQIAALEIRLKKLEIEFAELHAERDALQEQTRRIPALEAQVAEQRALIAAQAGQIAQQAQALALAHVATEPAGPPAEP